MGINRTYQAALLCFNFIAPLTIKDKSNEKMKIIADATNQEYIYLFTGGILIMYEPRRCTYT